MTDLILPDSRLEMPELFDIGRKPVGNVKINANNEIGSFIKKSKCLVVGPFANGVDLSGLNPNIQSSLDNLAITGSGLTTEGVLYPQSDFTFNNATELSIIQVIDFSVDQGVFHSGSSESTFFREASSKGVSFSGMCGSTKIRSLVNTNGSSIWTTSQDVDIANYKNQKVLIAMTWDELNRYMYIGYLGEKPVLLRSDPCTGICEIGISNAGIGGGDNNSAGLYNPILMTILARKYCPKYLLDTLCEDPYQFLIPA